MHVQRVAAGIIVFAVSLSLGMFFMSGPVGAAAGVNPDCHMDWVYSLPCHQKEMKDGKPTGKEGGKDCPCKETDAASGKTVTGICVAPLKCDATKTAEGEKPQQADCNGVDKGKPGCAAGDGKGGEPKMPEMPKPPGGGEGGGQPKPQTPQDASSTNFKIGGEGATSTFDIRNWSPYTASTKSDTSVFTNPLDELDQKKDTNPPESPKNTEDIKRSEIPAAVVPTSEPKQDLDSSKTEIRPVAPVAEARDRYGNPPGEGATGFMPPEEKKPQPESGFDATQLIPKLLAALRNLLETFIAEKKPPAAPAPKPGFPWDRASMLPPDEIKKVEHFGPMELIPVLQSEGGPTGKPFETMAFILCDSALEDCETIIGNGGPISIPQAFGKRMENTVLEEIPKYPDLKYLFITHDHPNLSTQQWLKLQYPNVDRSMPFPDRVLTGPSGPADLRPYISDSDMAKGPYEITSLLVEPGGIWVGSYDPEKPWKKTIGEFGDLRVELFKASQSGDKDRTAAAIQKFISEANRVANFSIEYLPSTATTKEIGDAAVRTRKNR